MRDDLQRCCHQTQSNQQRLVNIRPYSASNSSIAMRPTSLLSSVVLVGLTAAVLSEGASGVTRLGENENTLIRPVVHRKRENPVMRYGIRTGRSGFLDNIQQKRRRLIRSGDQSIPESVGCPVTQRYRHQADFLTLVPSGEHRPLVRQSRVIKSPQRKADNSIDSWIKDDSGVMVRYRMSGDNSAKCYCPHCRQEPEHYRPMPYHRFASSVHAHQSDAVSSLPDGPGDVKHDLDALDGATTASREQKSQGLLPEEEIERSSKSIEYGSAEAKEEDRDYEEVSKKVRRSVASYSVE